MRRQITWAAMLSLIAAVTTGATGVSDFNLSWHTVDGGGMQSTGERFALSGTIGQPDAGALTGGRFTLTGGFRFQQVPMDCNADGAVNLFDHTLFQTCMAGPAQGAAQGECVCFDLNEDGHVDLSDAAEFQRRLGT